MFHFDVTICAGHLNLPASVLTGTPKDMNGLSLCEQGIRSVRMRHRPLSKGNRQECLVGNCTEAVSVYLIEDLVRQMQLNLIRTSAISAKRKRQ